MADRSVLITGGAGGIGRAVAAALLARLGSAATVVLADLDAASGQRVAGRLGCRFVRADVTDPASLDNAVSVAEKSGPLRAVFLNAGVGTPDADLVSMPLADYRRVIEVNLNGVAFGLRAAVPALRRAGGGRIVVTSSLAGLSAWAGSPAYVASKHAVVGMVGAVAQPLAAEGITVVAVCPGFVDTTMVPDWLRESGFPLLTADQVADVLVEASVSGEPGQLLAVQPGIGTVAYQPRRVPAARLPDGTKPPLPVRPD